jgi:hypothetical protein
MVALFRAGGEQAAADFDYYVGLFIQAGIPRQVITTDILDCLKYRESFFAEIEYLRTEIAYGDYYKYKVEQSVGGPDLSWRVVEDMARAVFRSAVEMYKTATENGLYDKEGIFPYEYIDYQRGMFFLRGIR